MFRRFGHSNKGFQKVKSLTNRQPAIEQESSRDAIAVGAVGAIFQATRVKNSQGGDQRNNLPPSFEVRLFNNFDLRNGVLSLCSGVSDTPAEGAKSSYHRHPAIEQEPLRDAIAVGAVGAIFQATRAMSSRVSAQRNSSPHGCEAKHLLNNLDPQTGTQNSCSGVSDTPTKGSKKSNH